MSLHWKGLEKCPCGCGTTVWWGRWRWDGGWSLRLGPVVIVVGQLREG